MTNNTAFPTKKSMAARNIDDIPKEKMDAFLAGAKDAEIENMPNGDATSTTNVNVHDVVALIARESIFAKNFERQTYYIHVQLIKAIDNMAKKGGKGAKTKLVNEALQAYINAKALK